MAVPHPDTTPLVNAAPYTASTTANYWRIVLLTPSEVQVRSRDTRPYSGVLPPSRKRDSRIVVL